MMRVSNLDKNINNLPEYAHECPYLVVTVWNTELWFYGAYEDRKKAEDVAWQLDAVLLKNE